MIRIAITPEAFQAVSAMLPGSVGYERDPDDNGDRLIWLEPHIVDNCAICAAPARASATSSSSWSSLT
jgi:hypothetical protein